MQTWVRSRRLPWIMLLVILAAVAGREAALLWRYPVAVGIDGYYYVLQINHLGETGRVYFSTLTPLVIYLLTGLTHLTHDAVTSIKVGEVLLDILLGLGVFGVLAKLIRSLWAAMLGSFLALVPQSHFFMSGEYLNHLAAIVFLMWSGWAFLRAVETRQLLWTLIGGALLITATFSHRSALPTVFTLAGSGLLLRCLIGRGRPRLAALLGISVLWFVPGLIAAQPIIAVPLSWQRDLSIRPHWPFLTPVIPEQVMLAISSIVLLYWIWKRTRGTPATAFDTVFGAIAIWSLVVTFNPFLNSQALLSGLPGRLRILASVQLALIVPALLWLGYSVRRQLFFYFAALLLPLLILSAMAPLPYGLQPAFLSRRVQLIDALKLHSNELDRNSLIVARHGDQFVITSTIGIPAQREPPAGAEGRKVYWLLEEVSDQFLQEESLILINDGDKATLLSEESTLSRRLQAMSSEQRRQLLRANPSLAARIANMS
jgi:hypothetical protein